MSLLALLAVPVLVFLLFAIAKRFVPALDALAPLVQQLIVVCGCLAGSILYVKTGQTVPDELRTIQAAAVVGLIQGLASVGVHGVVKKAGGPT